MATLRAAQSGNKERLTVEWLQQSISEIRKQLVELQRSAGNVANDVQQRSSTYEDLATIRSDYQQLKLDLAAQRERQQQTEVFVQELREEMLQQEQDFQHALVKLQKRDQKERGSASVEEESGSLEASQEVGIQLYANDQISTQGPPPKGPARREKGCPWAEKTFFQILSLVLTGPDFFASAALCPSPSPTNQSRFVLFSGLSASPIKRPPTWWGIIWPFYALFYTASECVR